MRRLRDQAGLTRDEVVRRTNINQTTLYRIEGAKVTPHLGTLRTLLDLYGVDESRRDEILAYVRNTATAAKSRIVEPVLTDDYAMFINFEEEARLSVNHESILIPGLLQTADYAAATISAVSPDMPRHEVERWVNVRLRRQELLMKPNPLNFEALIDESALHRQIGSPHVMRDQLTQLAAAARRSNILVRVVPFEAGLHPGFKGPFVLFEFADEADPPIVYLEITTATGALFLDDADDIAHYRGRIDRLRHVALTRDESIRLIRNSIRKFEGR